MSTERHLKQTEHVELSTEYKKEKKRGNHKHTKSTHIHRVRKKEPTRYYVQHGPKNWTIFEC